MKKKHCWAIVDNLGNQFSQICNKTEAQISLEYPNSCSYYKVEEQTYCWTLPNGGFVKNVSESQMAYYTRCFGQAAATKVDCSFCEKWFREKREPISPPVLQFIRQYQLKIIVAVI